MAFAAPLNASVRFCGMARCANSGISLGADPWGRTFGETGLFVRGVSTVDVPARRIPTLYARLGDWPLHASWAAAVALLVAAFLRRSGRAGSPRVE